LILDSNTVLRTSSVVPGAPDITGKIKTAGLGLLATYDSRDNNYYPTAGQWFEAKWIDYDETWGGDNKYKKKIIFINHYQPLRDKLTLALRSRIESSSGDVPFFDLPTLQMGGFARDRYRDQHTISFHAEGRYKFKPRWGVIGFYEAGWLNDDFSKLLSGRRITSYGTGLRWQVTKDRQMHLGIDAAFSTDDKALYVQIGERF
jgi:outer membrane protein assembly factor BamA